MKRSIDHHRQLVSFCVHFMDHHHLIASCSLSGGRFGGSISIVHGNRFGGICKLIGTAAEMTVSCPGRSHLGAIDCDRVAAAPYAIKLTASCSNFNHSLIDWNILGRGRREKKTTCGGNRKMGTPWCWHHAPFCDE